MSSSASVLCCLHCKACSSSALSAGKFIEQPLPVHCSSESDANGMQQHCKMKPRYRACWIMYLQLCSLHYCEARGMFNVLCSSFVAGRLHLAHCWLVLNAQVRTCPSMQGLWALSPSMCNQTSACLLLSKGICVSFITLSLKGPSMVSLSAASLTPVCTITQIANEQKVACTTQDLGDGMTA